MTQTPKTPEIVATEGGALSLDTVFVGDTLIRRDSRGNLHLASVTRTTAKQIEAGGYRFRKADGHEIGSASRYNRSFLRMPLRGEVETLKRRNAESAAAWAAERAVAREAVRGRTAGFLLAAEEALVAKAKTDGRITTSVHEELLSAAYNARYDLESAEKGVRSAAKALRDQADQLDAAVERDADYVGTFYSQAMFEARGEEEKRAAAVKHGRQVVKLVARFLGVEFKDLVTPMAAPEPAEGEEGGAA